MNGEERGLVVGRGGAVALNQIWGRELDKPLAVPLST